ncbi:hypothetical protein AAC387_Pa10g0246 [Persea americana]
MTSPLNEDRYQMAHQSMTPRIQAEMPVTKRTSVEIPCGKGSLVHHQNRSTSDSCYQMTLCSGDFIRTETPVFKETLAEVSCGKGTSRLGHVKTMDSGKSASGG